MGNLTVFDLENLDLAYAPPYGSAKDPVILMGMVASNVLRGQERVITAEAAVAAAAEDDNTVLLDVRTQEEYDEGHLNGAVLIPVEELRSRLGELDQTKRYLVTCQVGARAWLACCILQQNGFSAENITGGWLGCTMNLD